ncbi:hypothetical protein DFH11DRAFT_1686151 [Phellopilus nigrolimitatus]|nr:hypothetical protein DFH11DRAFT_1686151 [Phellopilus nigrolimitatus]
MPSTSSNDVIDLTESGDSLSISTKPKRGRPLKASSVQTNTDSDVNSRASFKSVITTRGQKAREASLSSSISHLQTPPFGGGSAPPTQSHPSASSSSSDTPRLSLRLRKSDSVPAFTLPNGPRPRGRPRKHPLPVEVKAVDKAVEKLAARGRPSLAVKAATAAKAAKAEKEKAEKESSHQEIVPAVPSCATCLTPLSADNAETSRKGKAREFKEECTRCKRHYAIYRASWPQRNPTPGSRYSSTRENTPSEHASISTVDDKLKTARLAQLKRSREKEPEVELERARGTKRQKVSASPASPQKSISSFSGRTRVPSMKIRQHNEPEVKVEGIEDVPLHGPVGRTSRNSQKKNTEPENAVLISSSRKRGRPSATDESVISPAEERLVDDDGDDRRDKTFWPALPSLPPVGDGIRRTGLLNMRPNPMLVSRWRTSPVRSTHSSDSTPTLVDDDTDEGTSDEHPATPENNGSTPEVVESTETSHDMPPNSDDDEENENDAEDTARLPKRLTISTFKSFGLIAKPSPLTLSKRVWAPPALIADPDCEELNPLAPSEPMSPKRKRRKHTPTPSPTQPEDTDNPVERTPTSARSARIFESQVRKSVFDDFDASSGEEDVIIPGPSDSNLYLLQSKVTFSSTTSAQNAPVGSPVRYNEDGPRDTVTPSSQSSQSSDTQDTRSSNILNPKIKPHTLGPLHSDFLSSVPVTGPSPTLANAGWESDSSA